MSLVAQSHVSITKQREAYAKAENTGKKNKNKVYTDSNKSYCQCIFVISADHFFGAAYPVRAAFFLPHDFLREHGTAWIQLHRSQDIPEDF